MRDRYTYICLEFMVNVGKYTIHGLSGIYAYIYILYILSNNPYDRYIRLLHPRIVVNEDITSANGRVNG